MITPKVLRLKPYCYIFKQDEISGRKFAVNCSCGHKFRFLRKRHYPRRLATNFREVLADG